MYVQININMTYNTHISLNTAAIATITTKTTITNNVAYIMGRLFRHVYNIKYACPSVVY